MDASRIDAALPQTQCRKCGYDACQPYAQAIAAGSAPINRCPPGGQAGVATLAALTGRPELPLDPACGVEAPRRVARIDPQWCIGCTLCIQACPVDAIIGAPNAMHAVIASHCTGCDLCLAPCPVDCIEMILPAEPAPWRRADADAARQRFQARTRRLAQPSEAARAGKPDAMPAGAGSAVGDTAGAAAIDTRRALVEAAIRKARERLGARNTDADIADNGGDEPGQTR